MPLTERRFVKFGGGFGEEQLAWMQTEMQVGLFFLVHGMEVPESSEPNIL
jgi:hypothetical protein